MSIRRSPKAWAAVMAVIATAIFMAPGIWAQKPGPAKICPIRIEIAQDSVLASKFAAKIESDNALLATLLSQLRQRIAGEKTANPLTPEDFSQTYLRDPILTKADGTTIPHWAPIIESLTGQDGIIRGSTYIDVQSVHVTLEYLPFGGGKYVKVNGTTGDVDFIARIETLLAYAPTDDPVKIEGTLCHRKVCEIISCPPGY